MEKYIVRIASPLHGMEWDEMVESESFDSISEYVLMLAETHMMRSYGRVLNNHGFQVIDNEDTSITAFKAE